MGMAAIGDAIPDSSRNIFYRCDPFSEIDPHIEDAEGDHKNDHILLNRHETIKRPSEKERNFLMPEEEARNSEPLEEIDQATDDQEIQSYEIENNHGRQRQYP
jgi:hypothetical protein